MISVQGLCLEQGLFRLENVSLEIPTGKYGVLMGRTGTGKTTILEAVAGLRTVSRGTILLHQTNVTNLAPAARQVGLVPQDAALFRSMTVYENIAFALKVRRASPSLMRDRVHELASWLGLTHLLDRRAVGLSGGESQRIALARALSFQPRILLLDEPLSSLDEETRDQLLLLLESIRAQGNVTALHVTHSRLEAERLGDVILRIDQLGVVKTNE